MAWEKQFSRFGTDFAACYWRLTGLQLDFANRTAQLTFSVYVDEASAGDGSEPVTVVCVAVAGTDWDSWSKVSEFKADAYERSAAAEVLDGAKAV